MSSGTTGGVRSSWWARRVSRSIAPRGSHQTGPSGSASAPSSQGRRPADAASAKPSGTRTFPSRLTSTVGQYRNGDRAARARPTPESAMTRPRPCQTSGTPESPSRPRRRARRGPHRPPPRTSGGGAFQDPGGPGRCGSLGLHTRALRGPVSRGCDRSGWDLPAVQEPRPSLGADWGGLPGPLIPCSSRSSWESPRIAPLGRGRSPSGGARHREPDGWGRANGAGFPSGPRGGDPSGMRHEPARRQPAPGGVISRASNPLTPCRRSPPTLRSTAPRPAARIRPPVRSSPAPPEGVQGADRGSPRWHPALRDLHRAFEPDPVLHLPADELRHLERHRRARGAAGARARSARHRVPPRRPSSPPWPSGPAGCTTRAARPGGCSSCSRP